MPISIVLAVILALLEPAVAVGEQAAATQSAAIAEMEIPRNDAGWTDEPPPYPPLAAAAQVSGDVVFEVLVDADGRTEKRLVHSIPMLDSHARSMLDAWRFTPAVIDGIPVPSSVTVTIVYRLGKPVPNAVAIPRATDASSGTRSQLLAGEFGELMRTRGLAYEYSYACPSGRISVSLQGVSYVPREGGRAVRAPVRTVRTPSRLTEEESLWLHERLESPELLRAARAEPLQTLGHGERGFTVIRTIGTGQLLIGAVVGLLPDPPVGTEPTDDGFEHVLDVWLSSTGGWLRVRWTEPQGDNRSDALQTIADAGALFRRAIAEELAALMGHNDAVDRLPSGC